MLVLTELLSKNRRVKAGLIAAGIVGALLASAMTYTMISNSTTSPQNPANDKGLVDDLAKRRTASQITSSFENSTTDLQYGYAENIDDGRGITAGRSGFTSGTGDLLLVVQRYADKRPDSMLATYLPALQAINARDQNDRGTDGLDGLIKAWGQTSDNDQLFNQIQDEVSDELYFYPATKYANRVNVRSSLGQLIIWDTIIQHGEGAAQGESRDPDGLPSIIEETVAKTGNVKGDETAWLQTFLDIRYQHLTNAADPETRAAWKESRPRVDALRSILKSGNLSLDLPVRWSVYGDDYELK